MAVLNGLYCDDVLEDNDDQSEGVWMKVSSGAGDGERCRRGSSVARRRTDVTRNVIQLYLLSNSYYYIHAIIYYIVFAC